MGRPMYVDRPALMRFLGRLEEDFRRPGRLYLVGETIQVYEGWSPWTRRLEYTSSLGVENRTELANVADRLSTEMEMEVREESPDDVIPLPEGYEDRARPADYDQNAPWQLHHFDPYSVSFRLITRGDEPDYHAVLAFLQHGWVTVEKMNELLTGLLPQFTSETIQQDPAEFRRKFRGLLQMWRAMDAAR